LKALLSAGSLSASVNTAQTACIPREVARKHNAGVEEETTSGREAYAALPRSVPDTLPSP
jgi:hypothetical protein